MRQKKNIRAMQALRSVILGMSSLGASITPVLAGNSPFDGIWVIDASVEGGLCPSRGKKLFIALEDARIVKLLGLPSPTYSGHVEQDGRAEITLKVYGATANIGGKIAGLAGGGSWASDSILCPGGVWKAYKAEGEGVAAPAK